MGSREAYVLTNALRGSRGCGKFGTGQKWQELKPNIFAIVFGPTKVVP
jgi:hypothetical protein